MPSLTHPEAVARAELLSVDSYTVDLDLTGTDPAEGFGSRTVVRFTCREPGASTFAELRALAVDDVTLNGRSLDLSTIADNRIPLPDLREHNVLEVRSTMAYSSTGEGVHRFTDPEDGETYLYAMSGLDNAQRIFACFDQPDLKAPFTLTVAAPEHWTVRSNGVATRRAPGDWSFATTEPISVYLTTIVAGPYHELRAEHDGIPLGLLARRSLAAYLDADAEEIFALTRACFDWYHRTFGIRYPFGQYLQAFVPEFNWGAVENPGCVTFAEDHLFRGAVTEAERQGRAVVIAHEMAHMWFGDLVTLRWWDDIWLNESFAEYMGWRVAAEATEFTEAWTGFTVGRKAWGYAADQRPTTHPVAPDDVADTESAFSNFDGISYAKGAGVLRQLVAWLGDDVFLAGLRDYFRAHAFGNAALADLLAALDRAGDRDVTAWADVWLRRAQVNTLRPETEIGDDGRYRSVTVVQTAPAEYPTVRPHRIGAGVYRLGEDGAVEAFRTELDIDNGAERTAVPALAGERAGVLLLNDGDLTWAKVRFDEHSRAGLAALLPALRDGHARALVWSAIADASRDADLSAADCLDLLLAGLPHETDTSVFEDLSAFVTGSLASRFLAPDARPAALAALAGAAEAAMDAAGPGTGRQLAAARLYVDCTTDAERLAGWLDGAGVPAGLAVDADLRWAVLYRLTVLGAADDAAIAAEAGRDPSAKGVEWAARLRAARPTAEAKAEAWAKLLGEGSLSGKVTLAVATGFWQPGQEELTDAYAERYFTDAPAIFGRLTPQVAGRLARTAYPHYAVREATLVAAEKLLAGELPPALRRAVSDATDDLRRALAVRALG